MKTTTSKLDSFFVDRVTCSSLATLFLIKRDCQKHVKQVAESNVMVTKNKIM